MSDLMQAPQDNDLASLGESTGSSNRSRLIAVVAVAAGVVVLGLAAFFLFFSGGGEEVPEGVVPGAAQPTAGGNGNGNQGKGKPDKAEVPPVFEGEAGRDPFQPLPAEEVVEAPSAEPTDSAPTDPNGTDTSTTLSPDFYQVSVSSIGSDQAKLVVNGVQYTVSQGERFPDQTVGPFQLTKISADGKSVTLKYGSETLVIAKGQGYTLDLG